MITSLIDSRLLQLVPLEILNNSSTASNSVQHQENKPVPRKETNREKDRDPGQEKDGVGRQEWIRQLLETNREKDRDPGQ